MGGAVEKAIRQCLSEGDILRTPDPSRGAPFKVKTIDNDGIVLLLGRKEAHTKLRWEWLEGISTFLREKGWVGIGTVFDTKGEPNTLDGYMKRYINRATGGWIAAVLERAGVVEIDRRHPLRVGLNPPILTTPPSPSAVVRRVWSGLLGESGS